MADDIVIVGAGLAGASCAYLLAEKFDCKVTVIEKAANIAAGASKITSANLYPRFDAEVNEYAKFYYDCYQSTQPHWQELIERQTCPNIYKFGMLLPLQDEKELARKQKFLNLFNVPATQMRIINSAVASAVAGLSLNAECLYLPENITISIPALCQFYLSHRNIRLLLNKEVQNPQLKKDKYEVHLSDGEILSTSVLILCNGANAGERSYFVRGQSTHLPAQPALAGLKCTLSFERTLTPLIKGHHHLGATFERNNNCTELSLASQQSNLLALKNFLPDLEITEPSMLTGEAGLRHYSESKLPIVKELTAKPHLFINTGHGARGLLSCMPAARFIASKLGK